MTSHLRTCVYRFTAAAMKSAKSRGSLGAQEESRPPFDHAGKPLTYRTGSIPVARTAFRKASRSSGQRYAGSAGSDGLAGRVGATVAHESPLDQTRTRSCRSSGRIDRPLWVGGALMHFDGWCDTRRAAPDRACAEVVRFTSDRAKTPVASHRAPATPLGTGRRLAEFAPRQHGSREGGRCRVSEIALAVADLDPYR